ncbi:enoyl-CoA hydratase/isomerase family protein [Ramlibacter humi]|uniref:Enoyl-CoA hydratase/isomerase family protein n=1 Tax=Ramlibacter humi TaxID=2530451 RepID=A0A4Z0CB36_9BURK|nr:enoyl-CoA hydratase/isomerase family protein [Ramlibacter humi]TFZ08813.1 enoyl-CoA hydratase/isomerase family protein [Ramlibacter humi]
MESVLITRPRAGVAVLTIQRPQRYNALDPQTNEAMAKAFGELDADETVRCIVLTGAGDRAFCTGADIPTMLPWIRANVVNGADDPQLGGITHRPGTRKPLVAAVNGLALGGGLELALACDLRIASEHARFGLPEIKLGVLAGAGGCTRLPRMLPEALAAEMILTGEPIDAARALQAGLVSRVVAAGQLMEQALDLAETIASRAPLSVLACTRVLRRRKFAELQAPLAEERAEFAKLLLSADADEGIRAFGEGSQPTWQGL